MRRGRGFCVSDESEVDRMTDATSTSLTVPGSLPRLPAAKSLFSQHYLQTRLPEHAE